MRSRVFVGFLLVVVATSAVVQPVAADDEYPADCEEAPLVETPTTVSGTIDIGSDTDTVRLEAQRGDYISVRAMAGEGADSFVVSNPPDPEINFRNESGSVEYIDLNTYDYEREIEAGVEGTYEVWPQKGGVLCFQIEDKGTPESLPYDWRLSLAETDPRPPEFEPASDEVQERVQSLESRIEQQNETIADLRTRLEAANAEGQSNRNVTIDVEVTPSDDRQNFVTGGKAQVTVQNEDIDPSEVAIEFGSVTYDLGGDRQAEIALADAGTRDLAVVYGDTRESVTLNVREDSATAASQSRETESAGNSNGQTAGSGPGFGIVTAVGAAVSLVAIGLRRRRAQ